MTKIKPIADLLIESSYEICNKVGGIYTVVTSKAALIKDAYSDYIMVGPYYPEKAQVEIEQLSPPANLKKVFEELADEGINCIYGKWQIKGEPNVILVDFKNKIGDADDIKKELWESYGVETLFSNYDFTEPMVWAWCVGKLIEKISKQNKSKKIVSHFHEWLAGISLLYLKKYVKNVKTVFTTHATMLGRAIAGSGDPLYDMIENMDPYQEAKKRGVLDKFSTEKACAENADIFTTVSEITGYEAEKILGRKPEVLVLNGLDINKFPTFEETSIMHKKTRDVVREFLSYYFFPYYPIDLKESLNFFIFGRNEFKNKGMDIFIKSLSKLNEELKQQENSKTIFSFFFIPCNASSIRFSILESKNKYGQIKNIIEKESSEFKQNIINQFIGEEKLDAEKIFSKKFMQDMKKNIIQFKTINGLPPLSTHNLHDEDQDLIIQGFKENNLLNRPEDKVKVILYPIYVNTNDGLLNLSYPDVISSGHLGVFPSYYEPWGYTPLESAALGVPAITTDLAGFGRYMEPYSKEGGLYVLKRTNVPDDEAIINFTKIMKDYSNLNQRERVEQKMIAKKISALADWDVLIDNYIEAHNQAMKK